MLQLDVEDIAKRIPFMTLEDRLFLSRALGLAGVPQAAVHQIPDAKRAYARAGLSTLTPRELEIFHAVTSGASNKAMARQYGISPRTVEVHRQRVMQKMGARNAVELCNLTTALRQDKE